MPERHLTEVVRFHWWSGQIQDTRWAEGILQKPIRSLPCVWPIAPWQHSRSATLPTPSSPSGSHLSFPAACSSWGTDHYFTKSIWSPQSRVFLTVSQMRHDLAAFPNSNADTSLWVWERFSPQEKLTSRAVGVAVCFSFSQFPDLRDLNPSSCFGIEENKHKSKPCLSKRRQKTEIKFLQERKSNLDIKVKGLRVRSKMWKVKLLIVLQSVRDFPDIGKRAHIYGWPTA